MNQVNILKHLPIGSLQRAHVPRVSNHVFAHSMHHFAWPHGIVFVISPRFLDEVWRVWFIIPIQVPIFGDKDFAYFLFPSNFTKFHFCFLLTQMTENERTMCFFCCLLFSLQRLALVVTEANLCHSHPYINE